MATVDGNILVRVASTPGRRRWRLTKRRWKTPKASASCGRVASVRRYLPLVSLYNERIAASLAHDTGPRGSGDVEMDFELPG